MKTFKNSRFFVSALIALVSHLADQSAAFSPAPKLLSVRIAASTIGSMSGIGHQRSYKLSSGTGTVLHMSDGDGAMEKDKKKQRGVQTIVLDKTDTQMQEAKNPEGEWRVVLHNDEVHTFNYVIRSLQKVIGTLDKKKAFDICVTTHGTGQATIVQTFKPQAMKYCLGMQRQGLTASIAPEGSFEGGGGDDGGDDGPASA